MSSVVDTHAPGHAHDHDHGHHGGGYGGLMRWVTTTNHKDIGTLYLWFAFIMFTVGGMMALAIRLELFQPGLQFFDLIAELFLLTAELTQLLLLPISLFRLVAVIILERIHIAHE